MLLTEQSSASSDPPPLPAEQAERDDLDSSSSPAASSPLVDSDTEQWTTSSVRRKRVNTCLLQIFVWVIWIATCQDPLRISVIDTPFRRLPKHEDLPPDSEVPFVYVWLAKGEYWFRTTLRRLRYTIPADAERALIRFPNALDCTTFEKEHRIFHHKLKIFAPTQWPYISLIESVPLHNCGEILTVVAYGLEARPDDSPGSETKRDKGPKIFVIKLTMDGEIRWRDYPELMAHLLGEAEATYPPIFFLGWQPGTHDWDEIDPDVNSRPEGRYDFILVRHKAIVRAPGLSRWLDHLEAQRRAKQSDTIGHRYSIPMIHDGSRWSKKVVQIPSPQGPPFALSALYVRTENVVSPRPETMRVNDDDDHGNVSIRKSISTPNFGSSVQSLSVASWIPIEAGSSTAGLSPTAKPLDIARKRKLASSIGSDDGEPERPLRRSPRKHLRAP